MFVTIIILAWIWCWIVCRRNGDWVGDPGAFLGPVMSGCLVALLIFIPGILVQKYFQVETGRTDCNGEIYSLRNQEGIEGNFFLGSGHIGSEEYYYMFQKDSRGGLYRVQLYSGECYLFQRNDTSPHLYWQLVHYRFPKWYLLWPQVKWLERTKYDIIVPTNTVVERFQVQ